MICRASCGDAKSPGFLVGWLWSVAFSGPATRRAPGFVAVMENSMSEHHSANVLMWVEMDGGGERRYLSHLGPEGFILKDPDTLKHGRYRLFVEIDGVMQPNSGTLIYVPQEFSPWVSFSKCPGGDGPPSV